jgi:hypothetical protein
LAIDRLLWRRATIAACRIQAKSAHLELSGLPWPQERTLPAMTGRDNGRSWCLRFLAAAALLSAAACGGTTATAGSGQGAPATPSTSPFPAASGQAPPPSGAISASSKACSLVSAGDAGAALGTAVGKGLPVPPVNLHNGALGGTCEWADSAGGTALVITLKYPSAAIARKVFKNSKGSTASTRPVRLPDLAPSEFADTGTYGAVRVAQGFLLDGNRELNVTINEPTTSQFSISAFITLVRQAANAWR